MSEIVDSEIQAWVKTAAELGSRFLLVCQEVQGGALYPVMVPQDQGVEDAVENHEKCGDRRVLKKIDLLKPLNVNEYAPPMSLDVRYRNLGVTR